MRVPRQRGGVQRAELLLPLSLAFDVGEIGDARHFRCEFVPLHRHEAGIIDSVELHLRVLDGPENLVGNHDVLVEEGGGQAKFLQQPRLLGGIADKTEPMLRIAFGVIVETAFYALWNALELQGPGWKDDEPGPHVSVAKSEGVRDPQILLVRNAGEEYRRRR